MQLGLGRKASVAACVAALAAVTASSAQAAIVVTTGSATAVTASTATFGGTVDTGGVATQWQFTYSEAGSIFGGSGITDGGTIAAGASGPQTVTDQATGLTPSTTYTYNLNAVDVTAGPQSGLLAPVFGTEGTFTTSGPGKASLVGTKLTVKKGHANVTVSCSTSFDCTGGTLTITAHKKGKPVDCGSAAFDLMAGKSVTLTASHVSSTCGKLLMAAKAKKKGTVAAWVSASFDFQPDISKAVTLKLAK